MSAPTTAAPTGAVDVAAEPFRAVFPELRDDEYGELIRPLRIHDTVTVDVLSGGAKRIDTVRTWSAAAEEYPFQRYIRSLAANAADAFPTHLVEQTFVGLEGPLVTFLERVEIRLASTAMRAFVASINHARVAGTLSGEDSEARYEDFVQRCCDLGIEAASGLTFELLDSYRDRVVSGEIAFLTELCLRVESDRADIARTFAVDATTKLVGYGESSGDTHNHGRSVTVLLFADGSNIVYKPRDVSCEIAFGRVVERFNAAYGTSLLAARVLAREQYGYVEFLTTAASVDDEVGFFDDCGQLGALLFLLNARDMHFENIISTPRGPVAIDLETILHPTRIHRGPVPEAAGSAHVVMQESIATMGILPLVIGSESSPDFIDLGFLGENHSGGVSPMRSLTFDQPFSDEMVLRLEHGTIEGRNAVFGGLEEQRVLELGNQMADAFERTLASVVEDRDAWVKILNEECADLQIRYIHNPTVVYERSHRLTSSAQALRSVAYTVALLKRIALLSGESDLNIAASEMRQIAERDVPYFLVGSDSTALTTGDRVEVGARFPLSPLDEARRKTAGLSPDVVRRETNAIRLAFVGRFPDNYLAERTPARDRRSATDGAQDDDSDDMRSVIHHLASQLAASVLPDRFAHLPQTWIGPLVSTEADRPWSTGVLGYDLYTGRPGPALALVAAGSELEDSRLFEVGAGIFDASTRIVLDETYETRSLAQVGYSAYTGLGGLAFALHGAGRLTDRPEWSEAAHHLGSVVVGQVDDTADEELPLDVISGLSGVVLALRSLGEPGLAMSLPLAERLADRVLTTDALTNELLAQSGFAHGVSGALYALCEVQRLAPLATSSRIGAAVSALRSALDGFFDPDANRWASTNEVDSTFNTGWCHGAAGIGLALGACYDLFPTDDAAARVRTAHEAIAADGFGRNLTWCHGDLGNHDALGGLRHIVPDVDDTIAHTETRWLFPANLRARSADPHSRYSYANAAMVGSSGIILHALNRTSRQMSISPTRLVFETVDQEVTS